MAARIQSGMKEAVPFGVGLITGVRSMTGPAWLALAAQRGMLETGGSKLSWLESGKAVPIACTLAVGEFVVDKLPVTPDRTSVAPLGARLLLGGGCGAAVEIAADRRWYRGAALGLLGALIGAFAGSGYRAAVARKGLPDLPFALLEDIAVLTAAVSLYRPHSESRATAVPMSAQMIDQEARYGAID